MTCSQAAFRSIRLGEGAPAVLSERPPRTNRADLDNRTARTEDGTRLGTDTTDPLLAPTSA